MYELLINNVDSVSDEWAGEHGLAVGVGGLLLAKRNSEMNMCPKVWSWHIRLEEGSSGIPFLLFPL